MFSFKPLNPETWADLQSLFGERGACGGCWCMYWRFTYKEYEKNKGLNNKSALLNLVRQNAFLGVLAYDNNGPIGWCSISPKSELVRLQNSRLFSSVKPSSVWSITCLFVHKDHRNQGMSIKLVSAAIQYAFKNGAIEIEAYPIIPKANKTPPAFAWVGFVNSFQKAGFEKVSQVSDSRLIMKLKKPV